MFYLRKTVGGKIGSTTTPGLWSTRYTVQAPTDTLLGKISHSRHSSADITLLLQDRAWGSKSKLTSSLNGSILKQFFFIYFSLLQKYWIPYSYFYLFHLVKTKNYIETYESKSILLLDVQNLTYIQLRLEWICQIKLNSRRKYKN